MKIRKTICLILGVLMFSMPALVQAQVNQGDEFIQGKIDGKKDASGNVLWLLGGFGCGCLAVGASFLLSPDVPSEKLLGKSSSYVLGYTEGYKNAAKSKNTTNASIGCVVWSAIYYLYFYDTVSSYGY